MRFVICRVAYAATIGYSVSTVNDHFWYAKFLPAQAELCIERLKVEMSLLSRYAKKYCSDVNYYFRCRFARIHERPVIVLGNQKSGTSAFAHLLADFGGLSKTIDIPPLWGPELFQMMNEQLNFQRVVEQHKVYFSTELIKEPNMTFIAGQVLKMFPQARYLFVLRDPRDNIRSMLNRMEIPGHLIRLDDSYLTTEMHKLVFDASTWGGDKSENYICALAHKWNASTDQFLPYRDRFILAKYEDFVADKYGVIKEIAKQLDIIPKFDISAKLNIQYQPRGNRNIDLIDFFGPDNLKHIERICGSRMTPFGYD
jgi:Sulfotransferase family